MAEELGSMIVRVGLDGKQFDKGITNLNEKMKLAKSELRASSSQFANYGKTIDGLKSKHNILSKQYQMQGALVQKLTDRYKNLVKSHGAESKEALKAGDALNKSTAAYNTMGRTLKKTSDDIAYMGSAWGRTEQKLTSFSSKMGRAGENISNAGRGMMSTFGPAAAAVGGGLGFAAKKAMDFEAQVSSMQSVMSPAEVSKFGGKLKDLAITMGADTKYSATEAAQGIEELVKAGVSAEDIMKGGLKGALNLATAGELELKDAAEIASTALNAFKKDGITVSRAADLLAGAANASATDVGELKYGLSAVSAVASGVGLSFEDTTTTLAAFAQAGLKGQDAGTSLKTMLLNLSPTTDAQIEAFEQLGLATYNSAAGYKFLIDRGIKPATRSNEDIQKGMQQLAREELGAGATKKQLAKKYEKLIKQSGYASSAFYDESGKLKSMSGIAGTLQKAMAGLNEEQRQNYMRTMFGTDAIRAANILYKEGTKGITDMNTAMNKIKASDVAKKKLDNLKGTIEQLQGALETAAISLGTALLPAMRKVTKIVQSAVDWFNELSPEMQRNIAVGGGLTAVALGLGAALGAILAVVGGAASGIGVLTGGLAKGVGWLGRYRSQTRLTNAVVATMGNTAAVAGAKMNTANAGMGRSGKGMKALKGGAIAAGGALSMFGGKWGMLIGIATTFLPEILKGGKALLGFGGKALGTVKNIGGLTRILGVARLGFGALGGPIGLIASVAIPALITGGVKLYKHLKEKQIPALDSFGTKVSDATTKAVLGYKKLNDDATTALNDLYWSGKSISQKNADEITAIFGKMGDKISGKLKTDYDKSYGFLQDYFTKSKILSGEEESRILAKTTARYERQKQLVKDSEAQIKKIMDGAAKEKRALTEDEKIKINSIQANMQRTAVRTFSKSEAEQKIILGRLKNETSRITALQAAATVRNSIKARDGAIKAAKDKYNKVKRQIEYERDVTGTISADEADLLLYEAKRQRDGAVAKAKDMHKKVVKEAKSQARGHADQIDWETGKVKNGFDKMMEGINKFFDWVYDKLGMSHPKKKKSSPKKVPFHPRQGGDQIAGYAKGTPFNGHPKDGPAITSEKGRELINEPGIGTYLSGNNGPEIRWLRKGSSVLPNRETEKLLKSKGFPGYAGGIGNFFDWAMKGPKTLLDNGLKMFNVTDSVLPKWLTNIKSPLSLVKDLGLKWLKDKLNNFGGGGSLGAKFSGSGAAVAQKAITTALRMLGKPMSLLGPLMTIAKRESGFNPNAINNWDINAKRGDPSVGLFQVIGSTFRQWMYPGHGNRRNPLDSALAAIRYMDGRYGGVMNHPGIKSMMRGGGYLPYKKGGRVDRPTMGLMAENGWAEYNITTEPAYRKRSLALYSQLGRELGVPELGGVSGGANLVPGDGGAAGNSVSEMKQLVSRQDKQINLLQTQVNILSKILSKDSNVYIGQKEIYEANKKEKDRVDNTRKIFKGVAPIS